MTDVCNCERNSKRYLSYRRALAFREVLISFFLEIHGPVRHPQLLFGEEEHLGIETKFSCTGVTVLIGRRKTVM